LTVLGLAVSDIQTVLDNQERGVLFKVSHNKEMEISELQEKQILIEKLAQDNDWDNAHVQLETLEQKQSILQRLLSRFPGYYGKYLSLHFASFLNEPITKKEQQEAFQTLISYLDGVNIVIPDDLKDYLDETAKGISGIVPEITKSLFEAIQNTEQYLTDVKRTLNADQYSKRVLRYFCSRHEKIKQLLQEIS